MTAIELLNHLQAKGATLWVDGGNLRCKAPNGVLTTEIQAAMKQHKPALLELLSIELLPVGWWCEIECDALDGERITLCRDIRAMEKAPVGLPRFTLAEVLALAYNGIPANRLGAVVTAKRVFGGRLEVAS